MKKITDIIGKYTTGEKTLEETNAALKEAGTGLRLDPEKNIITEAEKRATTIGEYPDMANGWGLLDSGTGTMDKVEIRNGQLVSCDMGESYALVFVAGRMYHVQGRKLVD